MIQILQSFKTGELWLADVPAPSCKSNGIVMQNRVSFVSAGTERMLVDFAKKNIISKAFAMPEQVKKVIRKMKVEGIASTLEKVQMKLDQPIPLGYSCAGIVEEVGKDVSGLVQGDRVACGGASYANHAEYNYVPKNLIVKIPDNVSFEDASCATVGSIALQGIRQCDVKLGEIVCVSGLGVLGILAVQLLKASGVKVIGFDPNPDRCELAKALGADCVVSEMLETAAIDFSKGRGVDAVLITAATHSNEPVTIAGDICRLRGKVVVTGMVGMDIPRDMYYKKELDFKLSLSYGPGRYDPQYEEAGHDYPFGYVRWTEQRNIEAFLDCVASGKVTPSKIITHNFTIENALNAYDLLLGKKDEPYLGVIINYPEKENGNLNSFHRIKRPESRSSSAVQNKIGVGFIGAGNFTKGVLLPHLKKIEDISFRGICTTTGMNACEAGKKAGFSYATTDYKQLLDDKEINVVFVATRHDSHAKFVCDCISAGKHVFVEKPLVISEDQLEQVVKVAESTDRILMVGFNRRFSPHAKLIANYFKKRTTPLVVSYRVNAGNLPKGIWVQDNEIGGGRIIGEICHFIDFITFITDEIPVSLMASSISANNERIVNEDNCSITLRLSGGSLATINYVAIGAVGLPKERCEIFGSDSVAILDDFLKTKCFGRLGKYELKGKQDKGFDEELKSFFQAIRSGNTCPIPLQSLISTSMVTFQAKESIRNSGRQSVLH